MPIPSTRCMCLAQYMSCAHIITQDRGCKIANDTTKNLNSLSSQKERVTCGNIGQTTYQIIIRVITGPNFSTPSTCRWRCYNKLPKRTRPKIALIQRQMMRKKPTQIGNMPIPTPAGVWNICCQQIPAWFLCYFTIKRGDQKIPSNRTHLRSLKNGCLSASLAVKRSDGSNLSRPCSKSINKPAEWSTYCIIRFCKSKTFVS